ncbi:hypothetical protein ABEY43_06025 [Priestia megaterium]
MLFWLIVGGIIGAVIGAYNEKKVKKTVRYITKDVKYIFNKLLNK